MAGLRDAGDPLLALRAGDPAPFEEFVRRHVRTLVAFFHQRGVSPGRAEDLAQEVFLRLYQGAEQYRPEGRFSAYCFRLARNVWIDDCRRSAARLDADGPASQGAKGIERLAPAREPGADLALAEAEERVDDLLAELSPPHRRVFELAVLGELSYAEIGDLLAIPVGTVKSRMFYAVRRLRLVWEARSRREQLERARAPAPSRANASTTATMPARATALARRDGV